MTNAIVKRELTIDTWNMIERIAPVMHKSRMFGVATAEQAMVILLKGSELGLGLAASFEFIVSINDKPALTPRGALALILNSNEYESMSIDDQRDEKGQSKACSVTMKRKNGFSYTATYTMEDAQRADLIKPGGGWVKYPSNMLRHRAIGFCADMVFPDLLGGLKRADELGADITPDGGVIDTTWTQTPTSVRVTEVTLPITQAAQTAMSTVAAIDPQNLLSVLVQEFGAEKVLVANEGRIPATLEELQATREKLEKAGV